MKTPDYLSYERYKKKKKDNSKNGMLVAVTTFFVALLLFTIVAKSLSPNVDVTIGGDSEAEPKETGLGVKKFIDERLKMIQMDDNSAGVSLKNENKKPSTYNDEDTSYMPQESEEKINLPTKNNKIDNSSDELNAVDEEPVQLNVPVHPTQTTRPVPSAQSTRKPPRPKGRDLSTAPFESPVSPKMSKVYVGRYSTVEQAKVAQGILMDSGINITPFVKNLGSYYTLQVGSYSSKSTADGLASELQRNSFPARVVQE